MSKRTRLVSSFTGKHKFLSNFHPSPVRVHDVLYPTMEHYFQAHKSNKLSVRWRFARVAEPREAKRMGRSIKLRSDWEAVKHQVMLDGLRIKFAPGTPLASKLLATGDALLIEGNTWGDHVWGAVYDTEQRRWIGHNWLGVLLMAVRAELRAAS